MDQATNEQTGRSEVRDRTRSGPEEIAVALLTGGGDRPYVFGMITSLTPRGAAIDLIGSDELDLPELRDQPGVRFLNLRGSTRADAPGLQKIIRILKYYARLMVYAATAKPKIFHILWNNKFESFDRTLLMLYYKLMGKKLVFTAHNVNAGRRDATDSWLNRFTLRTQYRLSDRIFVHTENSKSEIVSEFGVPEDRVAVIPFGINNSVPTTSLTAAEAKQKLGIRGADRAILFFGRITPYKGLELLIAAFRRVVARSSGYRLIIAGRPDRCEEYWSGIREEMRGDVERGEIVLRAGFIPDAETEVYFKAADALILPYRHIYQSGVLFLGHSFGLPVLAADVGSLKDDIVDGRTGYLFRPDDADDLAGTIERYFASDLYANLERRRQDIHDYSAAHHSWDVVSEITMNAYARLLRMPCPDVARRRDVSSSLDVKAPS
jgi:glycosyltransferase involved in cell wall biosynthesis